MKNRVFIFKNILFVLSILIFLSIPFAYLIIASKHINSILINTTFSYPLFLVIGLILALFVSKYLENKIDTGLKEYLVLGLKIIVVIYALYLFLVTYSNYNRYVSQSIDVSYYHYTVWQLSEFKIPYIWEGTTIPVWSQHFEPILFFIVPIYWLIQKAGILMILQAAFVISGAIPIYMIIRDDLKSRLNALAVSFAYLAFGGLQFGFAYGFHPIMFFPTLFLWTYYFYTHKKIKLYFLFVLLSLFVKEEVAFIMMFWGFYLLIVKKEKLIGPLTMFSGLIWYFLCFNLIFPHFNREGFGYWGQYDQSAGKGVLGIIQFLLFKPAAFLNALITPSYKIDTIMHTFGSFSFLPFIYPVSFIFIIPVLLEKLLSSDIAGASGAHYSAAITGVTVVAVIESLHFLFKRKLPQRIGSLKVFTGILIFYVALFANTIYGYRDFALSPFVNKYASSDENIALLSEVISKIPKEASISAQYQIAPHIQKPIEKIRVGPNTPESSDFVIVDTQLLPVLTDAKTINKNLEALEKNKNYQLVVNNLGVVVFRKVNVQ